MNNTRQLVLSWAMYAHDNNDRVPLSYQGEVNTLNGTLFNSSPNLTPGWCMGWLDWSIQSDNTNSLLFLSDKYSVLARYFGRSRNIFKCPADVFLSGVQRARGWPGPGRIRSVSSNIAMGGGNKLDGAEAYFDNFNYVFISKISDFHYPGPSDCFVFLDEHPNSINDSGFFSYRRDIGSFIDFPGTYHNGACGFSFADGHAEIHKWHGGLLTRAPYSTVRTDGSILNNSAVVFPFSDVDCTWLYQHSPRKAP